jgi:hypothetical protein
MVMADWRWMNTIQYNAHRHGGTQASATGFGEAREWPGSVALSVPGSSSAAMSLQFCNELSNFVWRSASCCTSNSIVARQCFGEGLRPDGRLLN